MTICIKPNFDILCEHVQRHVSSSDIFLESSVPSNQTYLVDILPLLQGVFYQSPQACQGTNLSKLATISQTTQWRSLHPTDSLMAALEGQSLATPGFRCFMTLILRYTSHSIQSTRNDNSAHAGPLWTSQQCSHLLGCGQQGPHQLQQPLVLNDSRSSMIYSLASTQLCSIGNNWHVVTVDI